MLFVVVGTVCHNGDYEDDSHVSQQIIAQSSDEAGKIFIKCQADDSKEKGNRDPLVVINTIWGPYNRCF